MVVTELDYRCYNPLYSLYAKKFNKGLSICRVADNAKIATVAVRDLNVLAQFQWDPITGKRMTVFYKDGNARIYDAFQAGKLLALLRISKTRVDGAIWDRIELSRQEVTFKFDHFVLNSMPKMIRFARDTRQIFILPYEPPNKTWRLATEEEDGVKREKEILDVHLVHQEDNGLVLMLDGDFILRLAAGPSGPALKDIVVADRGLYHCFYEDATVESLSLDQLIQCDATIQLIQHFIAIKQLNHYLQDLLDLIKRDLVAPYTEFLTKICDAAFGYEILHEELESLLLGGGLSVELENWFCYTVGEKNFKKWKKMGLEMYQKTIQILTLSFIPACERLILLSERCRACLKALQLIESSTTTDSSEFANLTSLSQTYLRSTVETIQGVSAQEVLFQTFLQWFDDRLHEALDEDYKQKLSIDSNCKIGYQIATYLDLRINPDKQSEYDNKFLKLQTFQEILDTMSQNLQLIRDREIEPKVLQKITRVNRHNLPNSENQILLAVAPIPSQSNIISFFSSSNAAQQPTFYTRTLDKSSLAQISSEVPIELPFSQQDHHQIKAGIARLTSPLEKPQDHSNHPYNAEIVLWVSNNNAATCEEQFTVHCQITPAGMPIPGEFNRKSEQ